jgi:hypothetical protein
MKGFPSQIVDGCVTSIPETLFITCFQWFFRKIPLKQNREAGFKDLISIGNGAIAKALIFQLVIFFSYFVSSFI